MQRSRQTDHNNHTKNKMVRDQPGKTTTTTFSTPSSLCPDAIYKLVIRNALSSYKEDNEEHNEIASATMTTTTGTSTTSTSAAAAAAAAGINDKIQQRAKASLFRKIIRSTYYATYQPQDVLLGRGWIANHFGNRVYRHRRLIDMNRTTYRELQMACDHRLVKDTQVLLSALPKEAAEARATTTRTRTITS